MLASALYRIAVRFFFLSASSLSRRPCLSSHVRATRAIERVGTFTPIRIEKKIPYLEDNLDALTGRHQKGGGNSREETGKRELRNAQLLGSAARGGSVDHLLAHIISPEGDCKDGCDSDQRSSHTTVETTETISLDGLLEDIKGTGIGAVGAGLDANLFQ